jgi:hypothetical protein
VRTKYRGILRFHPICFFSLPSFFFLFLFCGVRDLVFSRCPNVGAGGFEGEFLACLLPALEFAYFMPQPITRASCVFTVRSAPFLPLPTHAICLGCAVIGLRFPPPQRGQLTEWLSNVSGSMYDAFRMFLSSMVGSSYTQRGHLGYPSTTPTQRARTIVCIRNPRCPTRIAALPYPLWLHGSIAAMAMSHYSHRFGGQNG